MVELFLNEREREHVPEMLRRVADAPLTAFEVANKPHFTEISNWLLNGMCGSSSKAMASCFMRLPPTNKSYPRDPDDFNRCLHFFEWVPEARKEIDKLREISSMWNVFVDYWAELEKSFTDEVGHDWSKGRSAPKTYKLMQEIIAKGLEGVY